jgi:error-prone DNA polymerase
MPDQPSPKPRPHPAKGGGTTPKWHQGWGGFKDAKGRLKQLAEELGGGPTVVKSGSTVTFAELCCASNFTFLTGASHPDEVAKRAAELGYEAFGVCDTNTLAGVVRAHVEAERQGVRQVVGSRVELSDGQGIYVWPTDLAAYGRLATLLTVGKLRAKKGGCLLGLWDLLEFAEGQMLGVEVPPRITDEFVTMLRTLQDWCGGTNSLSLLSARDYGPDDEQRLRNIARLSSEERVPMLATNRPLYHVRGRRLLQDVVSCIRRGCTLDEAGFDLEASAERHMKVPEEIDRLFAKHPRAVSRTVEVAERCRGFSLAQLKYQYPDEVVPSGSTAMAHLTDLARKGFARRFPDRAPEKVREQFEHELVLIGELNLPHYFLTVEDLMRWSREQGILCQGRGAAANSIVCYSLGVTDADPTRINTLFERFISRARNEPPDIDIDFEHERREEAIQYLYRKYGWYRAALTANVITYRGRSAVREVGKTLGFGADAIDRLAKGINWWKNGPLDPDELAAQKLDTADVATGHLVHLSQAIQGFPRHLSQHPGGFVLTQTPLHQLVPIENAAMPDRTVIEWDKDDIDALGFIKVDVLGLGMLTCMAKGFDLLKQHAGIDMSLGSMPEDCEATFDMICRADTMGTFQIESRAQMSMLPRLRPRCFYDLVVEVAIVRPGPIQGGMVHPYLRRRSGEEPMPKSTGRAIDWITAKTFGVPIFQEQAMLMAVHCAGFTPDEADGLRRAVTGFRRFGDIDDYEQKIVEGMIQNGYDRAFAEQCFKQIQGFSTYGFPESHAASFALIAYASCYFKCHWPGVFLAAILNSQPLGFYKPAQLVQCAQRHGVTVLPVDALHSDWNCTLPTGDLMTVRLGLRSVKGLRRDDAEKIVRHRYRNMRTVEHLWRVSGCSARAIKCLAQADAFGSLRLDRQSALWHAGKLRDEDTPLFDGIREPQESVALPALEPLRHVLSDYAQTGLSLKDHPVRFLRDALAARDVVTADQLADADRFPRGRGVAVAGICLVRQRPGSAKSITFITLEDETGMSNLVVYPNIFDRFKRTARDATAMLVRGRIDRQGDVVHVIATMFESLDGQLASLRGMSRNFH